MVTFLTVIYLTSLPLSVLTFISTIFVLFRRLHTFNILPKALRIYLFVCFFPITLLLATLTGTLALYYFIYDFQSTLTTEILNYTLAFSCQSIRIVFFTLIVERIVATRKWETYTLSDKISLSGILAFCSFGTSLCYVAFLVYTRYAGFAGIFMQIVNYFVLTVHTFTLLVCILLYYLNKKMYKITAYRITLKQRHQIVENVKVLKYLFPSILIHTLLTPAGTLIAMLISFYKFPAFPASFMHLFYNLPILLICIRHIRMNTNVLKNGPSVGVQNAFGKSLPTTLPPDNYFLGLQQQWR